MRYFKKTFSLTRGYGLLEKLLSIKRANIANKLINDVQRNGRLLDIGCGTFPYFLLKTDFSEKYGIDKVINEDYKTKFATLILIDHDIEKECKIPFDDNYFDVITMLAVFEHIEPKKILKIVKEVNRVLKNGGIYIITTPAEWTDGLLRFLAKLHLVSPVEIEEHKDVYNPSKISTILEKGNFEKNKIRFGYFEIFMNIYVKIQK